MPKLLLKATSNPLVSRIRRLDQLLDKLCLIPEQETTGDAVRNQANSLMPKPCDNWDELIHTWNKAMKWNEGLDIALSVMLSCCVSTMAVGDQLWIKIVGPPSCGKSTLCEAISVATKYVYAKSTFRGFHSGAGDGVEDHSLISKVSGKTLVCKDGDTLLQSPNLSQILSEARDIYDTVSRTSYRNKASKDYSGIRMTWILAGTRSLRLIDASELGERFLDCIMMDGIDDDMEDEVLMSVADRVDRNMSIEAHEGSSIQYEPAMIDAMQRTGGYVVYLRTNARDLLSGVSMSRDAKLTCARLGKLVAYMRARPSKDHNEKAEREFAARLTSQLTRLAKCLAVVLNYNEVNEQVLYRVRKVALDTARGVSLDIVDQLHRVPTGMEVRAIQLYTGKKEEAVRDTLAFLISLGAVTTLASTGAGSYRYKLSDRFKVLYTEGYGL